MLQVEAKYTLLARDLMAFERDATQHWLQHAHASAEGLLRQPVLVEDPDTHRSLSHILSELCQAAYLMTAIWQCSVATMFMPDISTGVAHLEPPWRSQCSTVWDVIALRASGQCCRRDEGSCIMISIGCDGLSCLRTYM